MARVVVIATDLMLASRVEATLGAAGHEVALAPQPSAVRLEGVELIVADLDGADPEALAALGAPVLAYYAHTDVETRRAAEAAGLDLVVPRSRLARELPELAARILKG